jgi:hypothetical protein
MELSTFNYGWDTISGMIISESKDIRLEYAVKVVPNILIRRMKLNVSIENFEQ